MMHKNNFMIKIILLIGEFFVFCLSLTSAIVHISSLNVKNEVENIYPIKITIACGFLMCVMVFVMFSAIIREYPRLLLLTLIFKIVLVITPDAYHFLGFEWNIIHYFEIYTILRAAILGMLNNTYFSHIINIITINYKKHIIMITLCTKLKIVAIYFLYMF